MIDKWDCWGNSHIKNSSFVIIISDPSHMMKWHWSIYKWWNESDLKEDGSTKRTHPQQTYNDDNDKDCSSQQTNIPIISGERVWCYFRQQAGSQDLQCNRRQTVCVEIPIWPMREQDPGFKMSTKLFWLPFFSFPRPMPTGLCYFLLGSWSKALAHEIILSL